MVGDQIIMSSPSLRAADKDDIFSERSSKVVQPSGKSDREFNVMREGLAENVIQVYLQQLSPGG